MLEILHSTGGQKGVFYNSGPGPIALEFGDIELGFFGEVTQSELFSPAQINASLQNLAGASIINPTSVWLKFAYKKKFLFIAKQPMFGTVNWDGLYDNGLIYGTDDSGTYNNGKLRNQIRLIGKNSHRFKIRTITADDVDPSEISVTGLDNANYHASEVTDLLYRVYDFDTALYPEKFARYTDAQLGTGGGYEIVRETSKTNASDGYVRGNSSIMRTFLDAKARTPAVGRWRPVLELLPDSAIFSIQQPSTAAYGEASAASKFSSVVSVGEEGLQRLASITYNTSGAYTPPAMTSVVNSGNHQVSPLTSALVNSSGDLLALGGITLAGNGTHLVTAMSAMLVNSAEFAKQPGTVKYTVSN